MNSYSITHTVFKNADIDKYLSMEDKYKLEVIKAKIAYGRSVDKKNPINQYLIVNTDESIAKDVIRLIELNELNKHV